MDCFLSTQIIPSCGYTLRALDDRDLQFCDIDPSASLAHTGGDGKVYCNSFKLSNGLIWVE